MDGKLNVNNLTGGGVNTCSKDYDSLGEIGETQCMSYKRKIIEMLDKINDRNVLLKIHTVVKTHLEILKEKEQEG